MLRTLAASQTIGVRARLVQAVGGEARAFYLRHRPEPSSTDPLHLMILIKDIALAARRRPPRPGGRAEVWRSESP